ncbi:hypothetical protein [Halococcus sp. IIIV-5B]|uniref:hypothetical protein n=1 Tax=Halococcus sp. IIIV-5B TaxID=2321230 RepID=UPI000E73BC4F|nr:hypothetical protein [Halococcus sp. IIIV-5B]RJT02521.1 hypothetical protein D3261_12980 [Halococcus sp. IIIV-5B]
MPDRDSESGRFQPDTEWTRTELLEQLRACMVEHGRVTRQLVVGDPTNASREAFDREFGTFSNAKAIAVDTPGQLILTDGERSHIDDELRTDDYRKDLLIGLLLGDGHTERRGERAVFRVGMINRRFLKWLADELGDVTASVRLRNTAAESASSARSSGFRPGAKAENYHDFHVLTTVTLPWLGELAERFSGAPKRFPDDLQLTPTRAKMWYVADGGLTSTATHQYRSSCFIKSKNERERPEYLKQLFERFGFGPVFHASHSNVSFSVEDSQDLLQWMGRAPPGFAYKWETESHHRYQELKRRAYETGS